METSGLLGQLNGLPQQLVAYVYVALRRTEVLVPGKWHGDVCDYATKDEGSINLRHSPRSAHPFVLALVHIIPNS